MTNKGIYENQRKVKNNSKRSEVCPYRNHKVGVAAVHIVYHLFGRLDARLVVAGVAVFVVYYFMYDGGKQDGVIAAIRDLTGEATMFPLWTLGHWQCRERYKSSDELCDVLDRYRELEVPLAHSLPSLWAT